MTERVFEVTGEHVETTIKKEYDARLLVLHEHNELNIEWTRIRHHRHRTMFLFCELRG